MTDRIEVIQYKEFKEGFEFNFLRELSLLTSIKDNTFNEDLFNLVDGIRDRILNNPRLKKDTENSIRLHYVYYLSRYFRDRTDLFDNLFIYVNNAIENNDYIDVYEITRHLDNL